MVIVGAFRLKTFPFMHELLCIKLKKNIAIHIIKQYNTNANLLYEFDNYRIE